MRRKGQRGEREPGRSRLRLLEALTTRPPRQQLRAPPLQTRPARCSPPSRSRHPQPQAQRAFCASGAALRLWFSPSMLRVSGRCTALSVCLFPNLQAIAISNEAILNDGGTPEQANIPSSEPNPTTTRPSNSGPSAPNLRQTCAHLPGLLDPHQAAQAARGIVHQRGGDTIQMQLATR